MLNLTAENKMSKGSSGKIDFSLIVSHILMETPTDIVFSISELRKYIFDFACTYSDKKCAEKGLWNVLQLRLKPNSSVSLCIWFYAFNSNAESFLFWMAENGIQIEYLINYAAENGNELGGLKWPFEGR